MALVQRVLEVAIATKAAGSSGGSPTTIKFPPNLRMSAHISKAGGVADCTLDLKVYGLSQSLMNQLSTFGMQINLVQQTSIVLSAGDSDSGMAAVFSGAFVSAFQDLAAAPDVSFNIRAHTGFADAVIAAAPSSFRGSVDVATVLSGLATKMAMRFENNGVTAKLSDSYFPGTLREQAKAVVRNAGIEWNGGDNGVLAIWPRGGSRGGQIPIVGPPLMEGYPTFTAYGVVLRTLFNPSIGLGGQIDLRSSIKPANAIYSVYSIDHDLEANVPGGRWHSTVSAYNPKLPQRPPVPVSNPVMS